MELKQYGTDYGGFFYPQNLNGLDDKSIIYCVGIGEDISHDIMLSHQLNSNVYLFDPTPRALEHVVFIKKLYQNQTSLDSTNLDQKYKEILLNHKIKSDKIYLYDYGLYTENKITKFYQPSNTNHVSHSVVYGMKSNNYINVEVKKLSTIMKELNHEHIDLLKLDIEGCECDVLEQMVSEKIFPKYLAVDFDLGWHGERIKDQERCNQTIKLLLSNGYKILHQLNSDYSFVKIN